MKLVHYDLENSFDLSSNKVNILVLESEKQFFDFCEELINQYNGGDGRFCLSNGETTIPLSKAISIFSDYFSLNCNDKKLLNKLYASLKDTIEQKFILEYQEILQRLADLCEKLNSECDVSLDYGEEDVTSLLKSYGVNFINDTSTLLSRLVNYMSILTSFSNIQCFVFFNLKTFLCENELLQLYKEAELNDICLFLIENTFKPKLPKEITVIVDRDLCEILA